MEITSTCEVKIPLLARIHWGRTLSRPCCRCQWLRQLCQSQFALKHGPLNWSVCWSTSWKKTLSNDKSEACSCKRLNASMCIACYALYLCLCILKIWHGRFIFYLANDPQHTILSVKPRNITFDDSTISYLSLILSKLTISQNKKKATNHLRGT